MSFHGYDTESSNIAGKSQREKYGALAQIREARQTLGQNSAEAVVSETSTGAWHDEDV